MNPVALLQKEFWKQLNRIYHLFDYSTTRYERVSLTRNTVVNDREDCTDPNGTDYYRWQIHNWPLWSNLRYGETVYYEIVGYTHTGAAIMQTQDTAKLQDKALQAQFGKTITYSYGCHPQTDNYKVLVYRITQQTAAGDIIELPWLQIEQRCRELSLTTVPVLHKQYMYNEHGSMDYTVGDQIMQCLRGMLCNGPSTLDTTHLMEGVCVRIESARGTKVYKAKNKQFLVLEGVAKEDANYVDTEEAN